MDAFGWCTQSPAPAAPCQPSCLVAAGDDALLAAFLGTSFELHSDGGNDTAGSSGAYGLDLPSSSHQQLSFLRCQDGLTLPGDAPTAFLDSVDVLPAIAGAAHDNRFAFPNIAEEPARAAFSGYSTITGGGNISSGESNTYGGGHDTEVASPCALSWPAPPPQTTLAPSKRKVAQKYPAASATTKTAMATSATTAERRSAKRAAAATTSTSITFGGQTSGSGYPSGAPLGRGYEPDTEAMAQVKEMIYRAAAMRPVTSLLADAAEPPASTAQPKPRRKNVRISSDPQTVAARLRRERVSERLRVLQKLVPGGSKMDTATMLDEAASYLKFLKSQLEALETLGSSSGNYNGNSLQHYYMGRSSNASSGSNNSLLDFGRDCLTGYVKSNRNMQL